MLAWGVEAERPHQPRADKTVGQDCQPLGRAWAGTINTQRPPLGRLPLDSPGHGTEEKGHSPGAGEVGILLGANTGSWMLGCAEKLFLWVGGLAEPGPGHTGCWMQVFAVIAGRCVVLEPIYLFQQTLPECKD